MEAAGCGQVPLIWRQFSLQFLASIRAEVRCPSSSELSFPQDTWDRAREVQVATSETLRPQPGGEGGTETDQPIRS